MNWRPESATSGRALEDVRARERRAGERDFRQGFWRQGRPTGIPSDHPWITGAAAAQFGAAGQHSGDRSASRTRTGLLRDKAW